MRLTPLPWHVLSARTWMGSQRRTLAVSHSRLPRCLVRSISFTLPPRFRNTPPGLDENTANGQELPGQQHRHEENPLTLAVRRQSWRETAKARSLSKEAAAKLGVAGISCQLISQSGGHHGLSLEKIDRLHALVGRMATQSDLVGLNLATAIVCEFTSHRINPDGDKVLIQLSKTRTARRDGSVFHWALSLGNIQPGLENRTIRINLQYRKPLHVRLAAQSSYPIDLMLLQVTLGALVVRSDVHLGPTSTPLGLEAEMKYLDTNINMVVDRLCDEMVFANSGQAHDLISEALLRTMRFLTPEIRLQSVTLQTREEIGKADACVETLWDEKHNEKKVPFGTEPAITTATSQPTGLARLTRNDRQSMAPHEIRDVDRSTSTVRIRAISNTSPMQALSPVAKAKLGFAGLSVQTNAAVGGWNSVSSEKVAIAINLVDQVAAQSDLVGFGLVALIVQELSNHKMTCNGNTALLTSGNRETADKKAQWHVGLGNTKPGSPAEVRISIAPQKCFLKVVTKFGEPAELMLKRLNLIARPVSRGASAIEQASGADISVEKEVTCIWDTVILVLQNVCDEREFTDVGHASDCLVEALLRAIRFITPGLQLEHVDVDAMPSGSKQAPVLEATWETTTDAIDTSRTAGKPKVSAADQSAKTTTSEDVGASRNDEPSQSNVGGSKSGSLASHSVQEALPTGVSVDQASEDVSIKKLEATGSKASDGDTSQEETSMSSLVSGVPDSSKEGMVRAFIALGSNMGDRVAEIERACNAIDEDGRMRIVNTSFLYESEPMYVEDQDRFVNGACEIETDLEPMELLDRLQAIENRLGRKKIIDKGPRNIDLDIIFYGNRSINTERLTVPHPLLHERGFVLRPLLDLNTAQQIRLEVNKRVVRLSRYLIQIVTDSVYSLAPLAFNHDLRPQDNRKPTHVMSILNVTPDSFSDGGENVPTNMEALKRTAAAHIAAGATMIDIGGQSSRPGAPDITSEEEIARILPAIEAIRSLPKGSKVTISIDTYRAPVAEACIKAGAHIVNDISAGLLDPEMFPTVAKLGCTYIAMHMRGTPATMTNAEHCTYPAGVMKEVTTELRGRMEDAVSAGVRRWRIILDPGIGFAKTEEQNLELLRRMKFWRHNAAKFKRSPFLVGSSRKGFIGRITGVDTPSERTWGTAATVTAAIAGGADIVRVHDVAEMVQVARMSDAIYRVDDREGTNDT